MHALVRPAVVAAFVACGYASAQPYDPDRPLYDSRAQGFAVDQLPMVLEAAYARGRPVLFYVHGRGPEPRKSFDTSVTGGGALPRLEKEFGVTVLMVNWNSVASGRDREAPLKEAPEGAANLHATLERLRDYQSRNPDARRPALLVHSMGSIVVRAMLAMHGWPAVAGRPLFSNVLLSQPDADAQDHAAWLAKLAAVERVVVTHNSGDTVLRKSTDAREPTSNFALGLDPVPPLAANARYVDLSDAVATKRIALFIRLGAHQVFRKSWMGGNVGTCLLVRHTLQGTPMDIAALPAARQIEPGSYRLSASRDPGHECFRDTDDSGADEED